MSHRLRIIGGEWRSRHIEFPPVAAIRPTPDRVRETLFNWLQGDIHGSKCLEPFAGSGILGIEALSRGASHCTSLDLSLEAVKALQQNLQNLGAQEQTFECVRADARRWLKEHTDTFDLIFLDPPFADNDLNELLELCCEHLKDEALIYVESAAPVEIKSIPKSLALYRQKRAGAVHYALLQRVSNQP